VTGGGRPDGGQVQRVQQRLSGRQRCRGEGDGDPHLAEGAAKIDRDQAPFLVSLEGISPPGGGIPTPGDPKRGVQIWEGGR